MVLCVVIGCSKRSGRDKDVSFYRIPKVIAHRGKQEYELTKKRRAGFLAAISRDTKGTRVLENERICSRHFISGKPAYLYDEANPDWLPTLHLGHLKKPANKQCVDRWARKQAREESVKVAESEAAVALLSIVDTPLGDTELLETGDNPTTKQIIQQLSGVSLRRCEWRTYKNGTCYSCSEVSREITRCKTTHQTYTASCQKLSSDFTITDILDPSTDKLIISFERFVRLELLRCDEVRLQHQICH